MIEWEEITSNRLPVSHASEGWHINVWRAKVPGGWLILTRHTQDALAFYPDPQHKWDGSSLP